MRELSHYLTCGLILLAAWILLAGGLTWLAFSKG